MKLIKTIFFIAFGVTILFYIAIAIASINAANNPEAVGSFFGKIVKGYNEGQK